MALGRDDDRPGQSGEQPDSKAIDHEHSLMQSPCVAAKEDVPTLHRWDSYTAARFTFSSGMTIGLSMKNSQHVFAKRKLARACGPGQQFLGGAAGESNPLQKA
jgi:hypothetical protein